MQVDEGMLIILATVRVPAAFTDPKDVENLCVVVGPAS